MLPSFPELLEELVQAIVQFVGQLEDLCSVGVGLMVLVGVASVVWMVKGRT